MVTEAQKRVCDGFLLIAQAEIDRGVAETPDPNTQNPRIQEYQATTTKARSYWRDEVPWCSSFANWVTLQSGIVGTREPSARGWLKWRGGERITDPVPGCIVVFWRPLPLVNGVSAGVGGHVGFYVRREGESIIVRGGNQGNRVCDKPYPAKRLLGYMVPRVDVALPVA